MSKSAKFLLGAAAVIAIPFIVVWGFGAFLKWDIGWAFEDTEARWTYIITVLVGFFGAFCMVAN